MKMMKRLTAALGLVATLLTGMDAGAQSPAPYPVVLDSRNPTAPALSVSRASQRTFRMEYLDGTNKSPVGLYVPFMSWSTNSTSSSVVTASYAVVSASNTNLLHVHGG